MINDLLSDNVHIEIVKKPFRYIIVDNLFCDPFYKSFCESFTERMDRGLSERYKKNKFWKFGHYDAYCYTFNPKKDEFSKTFYSLEWRTWVNKFFDLKLNKSMLAEFHHHLPHSKKGYIHNDYDISSFIKEPFNGVNPHTHQIDYRGRTEGADIYCVRSIAMIYYFNNPDVFMGGETGLFENEIAVRKVEPYNNRLLAFEVSPKSWHSFLSNKAIRNSMVMWFHSPEAYMTKRYGEAAK
jgi:hypothetical protein